MNDAEAKSNPAYCSSTNRMLWPIAASMAVHGITRRGGIGYNRKTDCRYGCTDGIGGDGTYELPFCHNSFPPIINNVIAIPNAIQIISKNALMSRAVPANTCPSIMSIIPLINGTPGIK